MRQRDWPGFLTMGLCMGLTLCAATARAHHSFAAQYDADKPVTLEGMVTKVEWFNPHVYFYLDIADDDGNVTQWAFEMSAPLALRNRGWNRDSLSIGDIVEVDGVLARDGSRLVNAFAVLFTSTGARLAASTTQTAGARRE